jgi:hypothetical protein
MPKPFIPRQAGTSEDAFTIGVEGVRLRRTVDAGTDTLVVENTDATAPAQVHLAPDTTGAARIKFAGPKFLTSPTIEVDVITVIDGGVDDVGSGGIIHLRAGDATGINGNGGDIYLDAGAGSGSGNDGIVKITASGTEYRFGKVLEIDGDPGNPGQVLTSNGATVAPSWQTISGGSFVPYYIPISDTFYVPVNQQALYNIPITVDGTLEVDGLLVEV